MEDKTVSRRREWVAVMLAVALIVVAAAPWSGFTAHAHWDRIGWIPFVSPPVKILDLLVNAILFAPLGAAVACGARSRPVAKAAAAALIVAIPAELWQVFSHSRFPSATDVTVNVAAATLVAWVVRRHILTTADDSAAAETETERTRSPGAPPMRQPRPPEAPSQP